VLLSGAVTLAAGLRHLTERDLGLRPEQLVSFSVSVPAVRYDSSEGQIAFTGRLLDELRATPGVEAVAGSMPLPLTGKQMQVSFSVPDRPTAPSARPAADTAIVTAGYFEAVGASVIAGRTFTEDDDARHPRVVVVNRAFAAKFFPGDRQVVGKAIVPGASSDLDPQDGKGTVRRIVGVVANVRQSALGSEPEPMYYLPYRQMPWMVPSIVVRLHGTPAGLDAQFRRAVAAVDPHVALHELRTFEAVLATGVSAPRFGALVLGGFAGVALLLVATGLYGVLTYAVLRRTREIGVRIALGASRRAIATLIGGWAARLVGIGLVLGIVGATAAGELIRRVFLDPGVSAVVPLAAVTGIVLVTSVAAACLPAARAASVEPTISLRAD
jgi:putative ABC transport system permease protein